jgi:cell division septum initiation protein DivIVA
VRRRIREVVRDLGGERKQTDQLKEDVEKLQTEHLDLRSRLSRLEARLKESASASIPAASTSKKAPAAPAKTKKSPAPKRR